MRISRFCRAMRRRAAPADRVRVRRRTPYRPANDSEILETLPAGSGSAADRATRALHAQRLARDPGNLDLALRLARSTSRARASNPIRARSAAPRRRSRRGGMRASRRCRCSCCARRSSRAITHSTDARADLERALAREPANAQAWLTLATVQQVTGDLAGAARKLPAASRTSRSRADRVDLRGVGRWRQRARAADAYDALDRLHAHAGDTRRGHAGARAPGRRRCRPNWPNGSAAPTMPSGFFARAVRSIRATSTRSRPTPISCSTSVATPRCSR